jgi:hypothetical protein
VRAELNDTVVEIAKQVEQILTAVFNINKRLKGRVDMTMALGLSDIKAQMAGWFIAVCHRQRFPPSGDTLRYLQAIEKRLEKMAIDPHRDRAQMLKVESVQQAWQQWLNKLPPARREDEDVQEIRWMIEELRVSFFAQQLGTPYPISDKRYCRRWSRFPLIPRRCLIRPVGFRGSPVVNGLHDIVGPIAPSGSPARIAGWRRCLIRPVGFPGAPRSLTPCTIL